MPTVLVVHLEIQPPHFDAFVAEVRAHGARSQQLEEGCLGFQVLLPVDAPNRLILVETYRDDAALEAHLASAHMADYLQRTGPMVRDRQRHRCTL